MKQNYFIIILPLELSEVIEIFFLGKGGPELNNDIWYQYKEGYNNAVRKIIKISDLS